MRLLAVALLALAAACQSSEPPPTGNFSARIFEDIPTPKEARYIDHDYESFSYQAPTWRSGRFHFGYKGGEARAISFFRRMMTNPTYGWTFEKEDRRRAGSTTLFFTKNDDRCRIDIDSQPALVDGRREDVDIMVRVNHRR